MRNYKHHDFEFAYNYFHGVYLAKTSGIHVKQLNILHIHIYNSNIY